MYFRAVLTVWSSRKLFQPTTRLLLSLPVLRSRYRFPLLLWSMSGLPLRSMGQRDSTVLIPRLRQPPSLRSLNHLGLSWLLAGCPWLQLWDIPDAGLQFERLPC